MIQAFENMKNGRLDLVNDGMLFPLLRWFSGHQPNLPICSKVNRLFFYVKPRILKSLLSLGIDKRVRFLKYPKPRKDDDKIFVLVKDYFKQIFGWSEREANFHGEEIKSAIQDINALKELSLKVGMNKKECKILGLEFQSFKKPKVIKSVSKSLLDF